jgi:hypothetical protein
MPEQGPVGKVWSVICWQFALWRKALVRPGRHIGERHDSRVAAGPVGVTRTWADRGPPNDETALGPGGLESSLQRQPSRALAWIVADPMASTAATVSACSRPAPGGSACTDPRLLDKLRRAAAFLHGHGAGDGAVAVDDAIELLKVERPARKRGEPLAEECGAGGGTLPGVPIPGAEDRASGSINGPRRRHSTVLPPTSHSAAVQEEGAQT